MIFTRKFFKTCISLIVILTLFNFVYVYVNKSRIDHYFVVNPKVAANYRKISWEDWDLIHYEATRVGPGENGQAYLITDPAELEKNEEWKSKEGFYVEVSDKISLTRALPDHRPKICETRKYFEKLPNASVIITFHNEIPSTLLRCVHSIITRSPPSLLHEVVLINDNSTFPDLYAPLRNYVEQVFGNKVKLYDNDERQGLIKARMTGAKKATGEVLVFLDSHMEVYNTWLPPLLEPLVTHPTYATVPVSDGMDHKTFQPTHTGYGYRGMFDWNFRYQWFPIRPEDRVEEGAPYELPCMTGGHYAIRREHFFYLGGYDEGLLIWNGENYELCLKLWLCSGGLFHTPCSRVAHLSKIHSAYRHTEKAGDFVGRNLKRVAEVWLDEYKEYFYRGDIVRYKNIDAGDLSAQFAKKESLKCKPFKHYLDVVAPDFLKRYPIKPQHFAAGPIQSKVIKKCIGLPKQSFVDPVTLVNCDIGHSAELILALERSIRYNDTNDQCLNHSTLKFSNCHHQRGDQLWKFDLETRQIRNPPSNQCLTANTTGNGGSLYQTKCDEKSIEQKWKWNYENVTALKDWEHAGV